MGAFLLCKEELESENIQEGLQVFNEKGFEMPVELQVGSYRLFSFQKQLVHEANIRSDGRCILAAVGTPVYKHKSYADSLDAVFEDLKSGRFEYTGMYGSYVLMFYDGAHICFVLDDMRQMPLYSSCDGRIISTSFLACSKAYGGGLTINKMACLEKLCTGMITGTSTLFAEISRSLPESMKEIEIIAEAHSVLSSRRKGEALRSEAQMQIGCLYNELDAIAPLVGEYGADMGLSGGYDSRLMYGLLQNRY